MPSWIDDYYALKDGPPKPPANVWERLRMVDPDHVASFVLVMVTAFFLVDGIKGTDVAVATTVVGRAYTAQYVVKDEPYRVGKMLMHHDVSYGPYWDVRVDGPAPVRAGGQTFRVTPEVFDACPDGAPAVVVWRRGWITGFDYGDSLRPQAKPERDAP